MSKNKDYAQQLKKMGYERKIIFCNLIVEATNNNFLRITTMKGEHYGVG